MEETINQFGQVIGDRVLNWQAPDFPCRDTLFGHYCRIEPLNLKHHGERLFATASVDKQSKMWTYLPFGPFANADDYGELLEKLMVKSDQQFYAIVDLKTEQALGVAAYLRINPAAGSIEIGNLCYSPLLQRTTIATEAMYLMMKNIFEVGYRRYEWKCNSLNAASKSAALRLGFQYEGIFRQAMVVDGRNRDTAWYSIIDSEWQKLKIMFEAWLLESNFDKRGHQHKTLQELY